MFYLPPLKFHQILLYWTSHHCMLVVFSSKVMVFSPTHLCSKQIIYTKYNFYQKGQKVSNSLKSCDEWINLFKCLQIFRWSFQTIFSLPALQPNWQLKYEDAWKQYCDSPSIITFSCWFDPLQENHFQNIQYFITFHPNFVALEKCVKITLGFGWNNLLCYRHTWKILQYQ